jgi:hypothetical protein
MEFIHKVILFNLKIKRIFPKHAIIQHFSHTRQGCVLCEKKKNNPLKVVTQDASLTTRKGNREKLVIFMA